MGYRHSSVEILEAAIVVSLEAGLTGLTFGAVGDRLGISDRTVVYYFPTKPDLVTAVIQALGGRLEHLLEQAFGAERRTPAELMSRAWPLLTTPDADRVFALYFELVGLASAGVEPYAGLARTIVERWVQWLVPRVEGSSAVVRRRRALATVAQLDGLLLIRRVVGPDAAQLAARGMGLL